MSGDLCPTLETSVKCLVGFCFGTETPQIPNAFLQRCECILKQMIIFLTKDVYLGPPLLLHGDSVFLPPVSHNSPLRGGQVEGL